MAVRLIITAALCAGFAFSAYCKPEFALQAGAFKSEQEATAKAESLKDTGLAPITVQPEETGEKGLFFKVIVGTFPKRSDAETAKRKLNEMGVNSYIRTKDDLGSPAIRSLLTSNNPEPYFLDTATSYKVTETTLTSLLKQEREKITEGKSTTPQNLARYKEFIDALPNGNLAKAEEIITYAHYRFSGKSAYDGKSHDLSDVTDLLELVANCRIPATQTDRMAAREMLAHSLHYYSHNYVSALKAYRQLLAFHTKEKHDVLAVKARLEVAATSLELARVSGFNRDDLQSVLATHWLEAVNLQQPYLSDGVTTGKKVRVYTARIGLMLTENLLDQKRWPEAKQISNELIGMYAGYDECTGILAESYCHLAKIGLNQRDKVLCYDSIDKAIQLSNKAGKVWGDERRDTLWKAYSLKNAAGYWFNESEEVKAEIKKEMYQKFPGNPGLNKYFVEDGE